MFEIKNKELVFVTPVIIPQRPEGHKIIFLECLVILYKKYIALK
jgi:hypothetical protein